jgi:dihydropyrimidinase
VAKKKLLIQGGTVVGPEGTALADILVEGEKILALGLPGAFRREETDETIDAAGHLVLPGLIDPHLHFNSPFMGTTTVHGYGQGTVAAAFGGITTVIDFSTQPKGGSILDNLKQKEEEARESCIDWSLSGILLDAGPETLAEIPRLVEAGMPTYKCFTTYKHSGRLMDDEGVLKLLEATARWGGMLMVHAENDSIIEYRLQKELAAKHFGPIYHARTRPVSAETVAVRRMLDLLREIPAPLYIAHTSAAGSLRPIREARDEGLPVHAETCTHYLALTEEKLLGPDGQLFICSPPLRKQDDIDALWRAVALGTLEVVSSDDAGVPPEDNWRIGAGRFDRVPSGMSGIEPRLAILYSEGVVKKRISLERLVELTSAGPAKLFGLYPQKGRIAPGADADIVIYDPEPEWVMSAGVLHMNTRFCPFEGFAVKGRVRTVLSRGAYLIKDDEFTGRPGWGRRVFRRFGG